MAYSSRKPSLGLSAAQKARLCQEAAKAFECQERAGLIENDGRSRSATMEAWRRAEQEREIGIASLTRCGNKHFRPLLAHWLKLQGREAEAFKVLMRTGRVKDRSPEDDTHENREKYRVLILRDLNHHAAVMAEKGGDAITARYVESEAARKFPRTPARDLSAGQLRQLFFHIRNRIAAKEGRGDSKNRNKANRKP